MDKIRKKSIIPKQVSIVLVTGISGSGKQSRVFAVQQYFKQYHKNLKQLSTGNIFRNLIDIYEKANIKVDEELFDDENILNTNFLKEVIGKERDFLHENIDDIVLGLQAKYFLDNGRFVPDVLTNPAFKSIFSKMNYSNTILDGYPRSKNQAIYLNNLLEERGKSIDFIIYLHEDKNKIERRVVGRIVCKNCGATYHPITAPPEEEGICNICGGNEFYTRKRDTKEDLRQRFKEWERLGVPMIEYYKNETNVPIISLKGYIQKFTPGEVLLQLKEELKPFISNS